MQPWPGETANDPSVRNDNVGFFDDTQRTIMQKAAFGSVDFDIIPKTLIFTAGTRYYHFDEVARRRRRRQLLLQELRADHLLRPLHLGNQRQRQAGRDRHSGSALRHQLQRVELQQLDLSRLSQPRELELARHRRRAAVLHLVAGLPAGRIQSRHHKPRSPMRTGTISTHTRPTYCPDTLINNELGFKTEFLNHRLQVNGAIYQEDWKNTIVEFFDPQQGFGNLTFVTNGPDYRVRGGELQIVARVTEGLTVQGSGSYNKSEQTNSPSLLNNNPASPNFGKPILGTNGLPIPNVFGIAGQPARRSRRCFRVIMRIRYEFPLGEYKAFAQVGGQYYGALVPTVGTVDNYRDGRLGNLRCLGRRRQGRVERAALRAEYRQPECQHLHELGAVHPHARRRCGRESPASSSATSSRELRGDPARIEGGRWCPP